MKLTGHSAHIGLVTRAEPSQMQVKSVMQGANSVEKGPAAVKMISVPADGLLQSSTLSTALTLAALTTETLQTCVL